MSLAFTSTLARGIPRTCLRLPSHCPQRRRARLPPRLPCHPAARWHASTAPSAASAARAAIAVSNVMIFSGSYCSFCARVKALFTQLDVPHTVWELDLREDGADVRRFLAEETGQTTVPNVFIGGQHVGGCDDTFALYQQGELLDMINAAKM